MPRSEPVDGFRLAYDRSGSGEPLPGERLYERAQEVKELHVIDGGTHFDFYDRPQYVGPAITKINEFFTKHL